jgi:enoyl-CoA hydratase
MFEEKRWKYVTTEVSGRIMIVRFDSGQQLNTFTIELLVELTEVARALEDDTDLSAVVLTGRADIFSGGANVKSVLGLASEDIGLLEMRKLARLPRSMCEAWERIEAMTIVAIEGWCIGAGFALAVSCDLRVMGDNATLYVPEVERGITINQHAISRTVNLIGPARSKRLITMAEKAPAQHALAWGIADEISANGEACNKALDIAESIAALPPIPVRMTKQAINAAANGSTGYADTDQLLLSAKTEDFREAREAFLNKRPPKYIGK